MRALIRIFMEGCLGVTTVAAVTLLHLAIRSALRYRDRKYGSAKLHEDSAFVLIQKPRRSSFLSRANEP
jgi:hypothetical protein